MRRVGLLSSKKLVLIWYKVWAQDEVGRSRDWGSRDLGITIKQIMEIEELISLFWHQTLDLPKLTLLHKTFKAAKLAMADKIVLNHIKTEVLAANTQKKRRA